MSQRITFANIKDVNRISAHTKTVLETLMQKSGVSNLVVTSTAREPQAQAHAMYHNAIAGGWGAQFALYGDVGDEVLRVGIAAANQHGSADQVIVAMTAKIVELGASRVSKHCQTPEEYARLNVIDISASNIPHSLHADFSHAITVLEAEGVINRHFSPYTTPRDPAFHLEIPQPETEVS